MVNKHDLVFFDFVSHRRHQAMSTSDQPTVIAVHLGVHSRALD